MATKKQIYSLNEVKKLKEESRLIYDGYVSENPVVKVITDTSIFAGLGFILAKAGLSGGTITYLAYAIPATISANQKLATKNYYSDLVDVMIECDYDFVELDTGFSSEYIPAHGDDWDGGYCYVQTTTPAPTRFHGDEGWAIV